MMDTVMEGNDMQGIHKLSVVVMVAALVALLGGTAAAQHNMHDMGAMSAPAKTSGAAANIVRDPSEVPPPVGNRGPATVKIDLVSKEVVGALDPASGTTYRYWTFNGKVPGPMIRVREGDTVQVTLKNEASSQMVHSIDFHAALGPGGGAALSQVTPGQEKTFTFVTTTPGLYVYHCGTPMIGDHIANGMYGLILVEPAGGLPKVDHEYYVMQGEIYTTGAKGKAGLQGFSEAKLLAEQPEYVVFNGAVDALTSKYALKSNTGETVRLLFGNAGPNLTSSFHVVGHIFSKDYVLGGLQSAPVNGIQTISAPAGGATMVEMVTSMPGKYPFMDHAMGRMVKGLMGIMNVTGTATADYMHEGPAANEVAATPGVVAMVASKEDAPAATTKHAPVAMVAEKAEASDGPVAMVASKDDTTEETATPAQSDSMGMGHMAMLHSAPATSGTELNGCLQFVPGTQRPRLTIFHSDKAYDLEARSGLLHENPLTFAQSVNALVQVSGHFSANRQRFVVDDVTPLAPTCDAKQSLAQLRNAAQAKLVRTAAAAASGVVGATVGMGDMTFSQREITIEAGQTVVWKNTSAVVHNVVTDAAKAIMQADVHTPAGAAMFDSGYIQPGASFSKTFTVPGTYKYVCTMHETGGMKGVVVVKPAGSTTPNLMAAAR